MTIRAVLVAAFLLLLALSAHAGEKASAGFDSEKQINAHFSDAEWRPNPEAS